MELLRIENLNKRYYNKTALSDVNLSIEKGKIYGLLGPNGSGKTTLMKVIAGLHKQTSGNVLVDGEPLSHKSKALISYMPTENYIYGDYKVKHVIRFYKDMYEDFQEDTALKILNGIKVDTEFRVSKLSSGLTGKLKVALALSRNAEFYMLDEPLNGVDVLSRDVIMDLIMKSYNENKTMIISTHLVSEIEKILDSVIFLKDGVIELQGDAEELRLSKGMSVEGLYKEVFRNA
ncbi:ABC transporter ATP-binding protein [Sedimentibacter hydroxybenzoicus DSM 7310]|uniref:ABC transporter ATP-binding protein n=1 Tax=Sedimentibacter hydroxybenzoicus DSM 7310 TaxID=1123245 RepID=A0A974GXU5_SEDHY|nr:ABC transporter ATP-binding protein [Sedimentibacter hydroxybenzoicus]NYB75982.1 ABC transporter ATP-binding protein [Sedimentibacter hydroxybenzoicus DSM 7310]